MLYALGMVSEVLAATGDREMCYLDDRLDADLESAELHRIGNALSRMRKAGRCPHTWLQGHEKKPTKCLHCGHIFPTLESAMEAMQSAIDCVR
jgi:hypothetical protein